MKTLPPRIVIYTKDVSNITGLKPRAAAKLLAAVRQKLGKDRSAFVTVYDFADYTGIGEEAIRPFLL